MKYYIFLFLIILLGCKKSPIDTSLNLQSILIENSEYSMVVGETKDIPFTIEPKNAKDIDLIWSSSDPSIVSVKNSNIIAHKSGTVEIVVTNKEKTVSSKCRVIVNDIEITKITISEKNVSLKLGDKYTLYTKLFPSNSTNTKLTWMTTNPSICTIDNLGNIKALDIGKTMVYVYSATGSAKDSCAITVQSNIKEFITIWKTDNPGKSASNQIRFPGLGTYTVYWEKVDNPAINGFFKRTTDDDAITFPQAGIYRLFTTPRNRDFMGFKFKSGWFDQNEDFDEQKLLEIEQWGEIIWTDLSKAFLNCINLDVSATDIPNFSQLQSTELMFGNCKNLVGNSSFNSWKMNSVKNMRSMFWNAFKFNQPLNNWVVNNVTNMNGMFHNAKLFNQPLNNWDVLKVTDMSHLFAGTKFNQNINNWNVSNVREMTGMFSEANDFNQPLDNWNVGNVQMMNGMFAEASKFNQSLNNWDVKNVFTMAGMFYNAKSFNQPLDNWDVRNVNNMFDMFNGASRFNQSLGKWHIKILNEARGMLSGTNMDCNNFSKTLVGWASKQLIYTGGIYWSSMVTYNKTAVDAVRKLSNEYNWRIFSHYEPDCGM